MMVVVKSWLSFFCFVHLSLCKLFIFLSYGIDPILILILILRSSIRRNFMHVSSIRVYAISMLQLIDEKSFSRWDLSLILRGILINTLNLSSSHWIILTFLITLTHLHKLTFTSLNLNHISYSRHIYFIRTLLTWVVRAWNASSLVRLPSPHLHIHSFLLVWSWVRSKEGSFITPIVSFFCFFKILLYECWRRVLNLLSCSHSMHISKSLMRR